MVQQNSAEAVEKKPIINTKGFDIKSSPEVRIRDVKHDNEEERKRLEKKYVWATANAAFMLMAESGEVILCAVGVGAVYIMEKVKIEMRALCSKTKGLNLAFIPGYKDTTSNDGKPIVAIVERTLLI